jgi:hypothetical protein
MFEPVYETTLFSSLWSDLGTHHTCACVCRGIYYLPYLRLWKSFDILHLRLLPPAHKDKKRGELLLLSSSMRNLINMNHLLSSFVLLPTARSILTTSAAPSLSENGKRRELLWKIFTIKIEKLHSPLNSRQLSSRFHRPQMSKGKKMRSE